MVKHRVRSISRPWSFGSARLFWSTPRQDVFVRTLGGGAGGSLQPGLSQVRPRQEGVIATPEGNSAALGLRRLTPFRSVLVEQQPGDGGYNPGKTRACP